MAAGRRQRRMPLPLPFPFPSPSPSPSPSPFPSPVNLMPGPGPEGGTRRSRSASEARPPVTGRAGNHCLRPEWGGGSEMFLPPRPGAVCFSIPPVPWLRCACRPATVCRASGAFRRRRRRRQRQRLQLRQRQRLRQRLRQREGVYPEPTTQNPQLVVRLGRMSPRD